MIDEVDADRDGKLGWDEFLVFMARIMENPETSNEIDQAFKSLLDQDGDGRIKHDEFCK